MGNQCDSYPAPDPVTNNHCNDYGGEYYMQDFCSLAGVGGSSQRQEWCGKMGASGEWGVQDTGGTYSCTYDDCNSYKPMPGGSGCCGGCCGIIGKSVVCQRTKFTGDPIKCCLQDNVCNDGGIGRNPRCTPSQQQSSDTCDTPTENYAPSTCFSDSSRQDTCSPCHRDITSTTSGQLHDSVSTCGRQGETTCQDLIYEYCTGADLAVGDTSWTERWFNPDTGQEGDCAYAVKRNLFKDVTDNTTGQPLSCSLSNNLQLISTNGQCTPYLNTENFNSQGVAWSKDLISGIFNRYAADGFVVGSEPGTLGYSPFQEVMYQICCTVPIICQQGLNQTCSSYDAQRLSLNPNVANLCGCYLPDIEYQKYVDSYQINRECTPMCNRLQSIPSVRGDGTPVLCNQDICLIDNIAINLASVNVNGTVDISQVCGSCNASEGSSASCTCIVSDNTIEAAGAAIGNINIDEQCGSSTCVVTNPDPNGNPPTLSIPCDQITDPNSDFAKQLALLEEQQRKINRRNNLIKLAVLLLGIIIVVVVYFVFKPRKSTVVTKVSPSPVPTSTKVTGGVGSVHLERNNKSGWS